MGRHRNREKAEKQDGDYERWMKLAANICGKKGPDSNHEVPIDRAAEHYEGNYSLRSPGGKRSRQVACATERTLSPA